MMVKSYSQKYHIPVNFDRHCKMLHYPREYFYPFFSFLSTYRYVTHSESNHQC